MNQRFPKVQVLPNPPSLIEFIALWSWSQETGVSWCVPLVGAGMITMIIPARCSGGRREVSWHRNVRGTFELEPIDDMR